MSLRGVNATGVIVDNWWEDAPAAKSITTFTKDSKIFGETFHYADPIMYSFYELNEMSKWCYKTFGEPGYHQDTMTTIWDYCVDPHFIFWFSDEKNLMLFILRWS